MTPKMLVFIDAILAGSNPSQAYRLAYRAEKMSPAAIKVNAQKLLQHTNVALTIAERRAALAAKLDVSQQKLVEEYAKAAFADVADAPTWADKKGALDSLARILGHDKPDPRGDDRPPITHVTVVLPAGCEPPGPAIEGEVKSVE